MIRSVIRLLLVALVVLPIDLIAQFGTEYDEFYQEFRNVLLHVDRKKTKSLAATYRMDEGLNGAKGKIRVTFLNDSVFEMKDHDGKETFVFRGKSYYVYGEQVYLSPLNVVDSANCQVIWGTNFYNTDSNYPVSYCRFIKDSLGRTIDYYYTYGKLMRHETYEYEGDSAYFKNSWSTQGDSFVHTNRQYVYEFYSADSSFYTRVLKSYPFPDDTAVQSDVYEATRTYISYDNNKHVSEIRIESAEATNGKASLGVHVHRMKIAYKLR